MKEALINLPIIRATSLEDIRSRSVFYLRVLYEIDRENGDPVIEKMLAADSDESDISECLNDETLDKICDFLAKENKLSEVA